MLPSAAYGNGDYFAWLDYEAKEVDRHAGFDAAGQPIIADKRVNQRIIQATVGDPAPPVLTAPPDAETVPAETGESWIDEWKRSWEITDQLYRPAVACGTSVPELLQRAREASHRATRAAKIEQEKPILTNLLTAYANLGV